MPKSLRVQSRDLHRGEESRRRPALLKTFFVKADGDERVAVLEDRLRRTERKLTALAAAAGMDENAIAAVTTHVGLLCRPDGYAVVEFDEPPLPLAGETLIDGQRFVVERLAPSPFPGDQRRCAILGRRGLMVDGFVENDRP